MKSKSEYIINSIIMNGKFILYDLNLTGLKNQLLIMEEMKLIRLIKYKNTWEAISL